MRATLTRWGNSQGLRVPLEACNALGVTVGARAELQVDPATSTLTVK